MSLRAKSLDVVLSRLSRGMRRGMDGLAACLLGALALGACSGEVGAPTAGQRAVPVTNIHNVDGVAPPTFLARMADAPERVAHGGVRRVEYHVDVAGIPTNLVYDERVTADGDGHYAIEPISVNAPPMTLPQREIFDELQRARQGFFFKYRDLRVRDLELFLANYAVHVIDSAPLVAGVECVEIEVSTRTGTQRSYRLAVEAVTGLVMRSIERNETGAIVAAITFLEFTHEPALEGVEFHVERYPGVPLATAVLPLGFAPARPQILPDGYREMSSELLQLAGDTYVRRVYGDGLENVFFLQRQEPGAAGGAIAAEAANVTVRIAEMGSFRVAQADRGRSNFFVVGKISEAEVLGILRSAL
ncbi:MAG: hypothetical protein NTY35_16490 [Planctomycetota bacterium]|nr:hypothetical protein [Planctomycetota bacterium]